MYQNKVIRGGYSESINMLRFPLAILVVFVHGFEQILMFQSFMPVV